MTDIDPSELSGLIDGELSPEREKEVRSALDRDQNLRAEYECLLADDQLWSRASTLASVPLSLRGRTQRESIRSLRRWQAAAAVATAAAICLTLVLFVHLQSSDERGFPRQTVAPAQTGFIHEQREAERGVASAHPATVAKPPQAIQRDALAIADGLIHGPAVLLPLHRRAMRVNTAGRSKESVADVLQPGGSL